MEYLNKVYDGVKSVDITKMISKAFEYSLLEWVYFMITMLIIFQIFAYTSRLLFKATSYLYKLKSNYIREKQLKKSK